MIDDHKKPVCHAVLINGHKWPLLHLETVTKDWAYPTLMAEGTPIIHVPCYLGMVTDWGEARAEAALKSYEQSGHQYSCVKFTEDGAKTKVFTVDMVDPNKAFFVPCNFEGLEYLVVEATDPESSWSRCAVYDTLLVKQLQELQETR